RQALERPVWHAGRRRSGRSERRGPERREIRVAPVLVPGRRKSELREAVDGPAPQRRAARRASERAPAREGLELRERAILGGGDGGGHRAALPPAGSPAATSSRIQS